MLINKKYFFEKINNNGNCIKQKPHNYKQNNSGAV